ncbi:MAG: acyl-CoA dehydratase activase [Candidatus Eisenbacteria bacterium]|nr:acyl-CoA dehydratase activase [Candidatus Eisenbacteria bacterium]
MRAAGLDIGSRSIELVILETNGVIRPVSAERIATTPNVVEDCRRLLAGTSFDRLVATGYGRTMAEVSFELPTVTEIRAFARGAEFALPGCRSVLDIGGQDTKAIALDGSGKVVRFEMNDRCAAGAGRFLEMMASALGYSIEEFGDAAIAGSGTVKINSMCAVFAESEVVGLLTRGGKRGDIALAVHEVVAARASAMLARVATEEPVVFAGGAARNACLRGLLERTLGRAVHVPEMPEMLGALGAALIAMDGGT